jgi:hypothetical protein
MYLIRLCITYYPGFGFDLLFKVTEVKVKKITKLAYFVTIWPRMFYPCVNMYLGTLYIFTEFRPDRILNMSYYSGTNDWIISKFYNRYV